jgi:hypothetical protein
MTPETFWTWFAAEQPALQLFPAEEAASRISEQLGALGLDLCAEVSFDGPMPELVISARGRKEQFENVRQLVASAPASFGWKIVALRQARGFEFELSAEGLHIEAAKLKFNPLRTEKRPAALGMEIALPHPVADAPVAKDLVRLILQTGVGEEAASKIAFLRIVCFETTLCSQWLPIAELSEYLQSQTKRCSQ